MAALERKVRTLMLEIDDLKTTKQRPRSNVDDQSTEDWLESAGNRIAGELPLTGPLSPHHMEEAFEQFRSHMLAHFPILVLPSSSTATGLRSEKPVLFLAILNAASGILPQEMQGLLSKQLDHAFAHYIMVKGCKSLELIQALLVASAWYYAPPGHQGFKFNQLVRHNQKKS